MRGPVRIVAMLSLLLVGAFALAACGGAEQRDARNAYVAAVNRAQEEFASTVTTVSQRITPQSTPAQDRKTLERFRAAIDDVVAKLQRIEVPSDVKTEHEQLVAAMSGFGSDIKQATDALDDPNSRKIADAQREIATATQTVNGRIDAAIAAINSKLSAT